MKLRRTITVATAAGIAAAAGVIGAATASAATPDSLCVQSGTICAIPVAGGPTEMVTGDSTAYWLYNGVDHPGQIQENNADLCLQLDHADSNTVIGATCNGASYQKWEMLFDIGTDGYVGDEIQSQWNTSLCLTYNRNGNDLDAVKCDGAWYQNFAQYSS